MYSTIIEVYQRKICICSITEGNLHRISTNDKDILFQKKLTLYWNHYMMNTIKKRGDTARWQIE